LRMALGDPAECEEGGVHAGAGEGLQERFGVALNAGFATVPVGHRIDARESLDLEVVLDVNRERVGDWRIFRVYQRSIPFAIRTASAVKARRRSPAGLRRR